MYFARNEKKPVVVTLVLIAIAAVSLTSCGKDEDPGASSGESVSELAASTVSGAISSMSTNGASAMLDSLERKSFLAYLDSVLDSKSAWAATACSGAASALASCSNGAASITLSNCSYQKSNGTFYPATWNGAISLTFKDSSGAPYCPAVASFPLSSSGTGSSYGASGVTLTRKMTNVTKSTLEGKMQVAVDTETASGWDTSVGQKSGGTAITFTSASARTIVINGIHYTATLAYTTKKGVSKSATVWDHTVSTSGSGLTTTLSSGTHTTNGTIVVQHNLAKYTATATVANLTHNESVCGCLPTGGTITSQLSGGKTGFEILTVTGCGTGTVQSGVDQASAQAAASTSVTLSHCQ